MKKEMRDSLSRLRDAARLIEPDEAWVRAMRSELLREAEASIRQSRRVSVGSRVRTRFSDAVQIMRGPVMAVALVMFVIMSGSVASVSAAEQSLPGDFFYTLKLVTEQARLALTSTKGEKLKLKISFTSRRADDLQQVSITEDAKKDERVEKAAEILKRDLDTVKQQLNAVSDEAESKTVVEAAKLVDETSSEIFKKLEETKGTVPAVTQGKLREAQKASVTTGGRALEVLVEAHENDNASVTETDVVQAIDEYTQTVKSLTGIDVASGSSTAVTIEHASSTASGELIAATTTLPLKEAYQQVKVATEQALALTDIANASGTAPLPLPGDSTSTAPTDSVSTTTQSNASSSTTASSDG